MNETIRTRRLDLVPATVRLLSAELESIDSLGILLGADVPEGWPPGQYDREAITFFRDRVNEDPDAAGWYCWYALLRTDEKRGRTLVGAGGYFGPPNPDGLLEIGYSIVAAYEGRGYAAELVRALVEHGFSDSRVQRVIAHTMKDNPGSIRVLEHAGFTSIGPTADPCLLEYSINRPAAWPPVARMQGILRWFKIGSVLR